MSLTLKETSAISGLAAVLYHFLPGSGHASWKGHVNFGTVAKSVGVGRFWPGGSKKPAIVGLLTSTLDQERGLFQKLIVELVRAGIVYREKENEPIELQEIDQINGLILELGFKFPELWNAEFRKSLKTSVHERARSNVEKATAEHQEQTVAQQRSQTLAGLYQMFLQLHAEPDRAKAGFALELLLNQLFTAFDLKPRQAFRVEGGADRRLV